MAASEETENFPLGDQLFDLDSFNQTLFGNDTDFDQLLCHHEHIETLVKADEAFEMTLKLYNFVCFIKNTSRRIFLDAFQHTTRYFVGRRLISTH